MPRTIVCLTERRAEAAMDASRINGARMCGEVEERVLHRICEMCNGRAELFCKQEKATLCRSCDSQVHGANAIASRHERYWLCELCDCGIAKVKWVSEGILLCNECDSSSNLGQETGSEPKRERLGPASTQALENQSRVNPSATPFELEEYANLCNEMNTDNQLSPSPASSEDFVPVPEVVNTFGKDMKLSPVKATRMQAKKVEMDEDPLIAEQVVPTGYLSDMISFNEELDFFQPDFLPSMHNPQLFEYDLLSSEKAPARESAKISSQPALFMDKSSEENLSNESSTIRNAYDSDLLKVKLEGGAAMSAHHDDNYKTSTDTSSTSSKTDTVLRGFDLPPRISCMDDAESENVKLEKVEEPQEPRSVKVLRYKMKKERRRYSKKIRYQARKAYADIRPRFQGRFVKKSELEALRAAGHILA